MTAVRKTETGARNNARASARNGGRKNERVAVRLPAGVKKTLEQAALCSGRSLSDFVVESAVRAARETLESAQRMRLVDEDRAAFLAALARPPAPAAALKRAAKRYARARK